MAAPPPRPLHLLPPRSRPGARAGPRPCLQRSPRGGAGPGESPRRLETTQAPRKGQPPARPAALVGAGATTNPPRPVEGRGRPSLPTPRRPSAEPLQHPLFSGLPLASLPACPLAVCTSSCVLSPILPVVTQVPLAKLHAVGTSRLGSRKGPLRHKAFPAAPFPVSGAPTVGGSVPLLLTPPALG